MPASAAPFTGFRLGPAVWSAAALAMGPAILAAAAHAAVPFWPVPLTLQTLAVPAIGAARGPGLVLATAWRSLAHHRPAAAAR